MYKLIINVYMLTSSKLLRDNEPDRLEPLESILATMKQDILIYHNLYY